MMISSEICSLTIPELVTKIFCVDWSDDNKISLVTSKGIHIFELMPNPLCAYPTPKFKRSFMYPSSLICCEPFLPFISTLINNFGKDDVYSLMLEESLTPKLVDKSDCLPRIVSTVWSPVNLIESSKCLLATLTSLGTVDLTYNIGKNWYSLCNLSTLWYDIIKTDLDFTPETIENNNSINAEIFKKNLRRLQITSITWSHLLKNDTDELSYSYFITGFRSSDIAIWKIKKSVVLDIKAELVYKTQLNIDVKITDLLWITLKKDTHLLIIGFYDGRIYGIKFLIKNKKIIQLSIKKYQEDPDHLSVAKIKKLSESGESFIVIKNYFLLVITVNNDGEFVKQQHVQLTSLSITGLIVLNDSEVVLTSQDNKLYLATIKSEDIMIERIEHDMKTSKVQFLGLAISPSGSMLINITSPNCLYDHLITREPSSIQFIYLNDGIKRYDFSKLILNFKCLHLPWDYLELIRIKTSKETEPENHLLTLPDDLKSLNVNNLRIVMWLTLINNVLKKRKVLKKIDKIVGEISEAQPLIFLHSACDYIKRLLKLGNLTDEMQLSIHFLRLHFEVYLAGEDEDDNNIKRYIINILNETQKLDLIQVEKCNLCGEIIKELPWNSSSCPRGHKLSRCALTLLQITCIKYRNCYACGKIFHPLLDNIYSDVRCIYCDISAVYDNRIIGIYDNIESNCLNLASRPIWDVQSKTQDNETLVINEKSDKKLTIENTFSSTTLNTNHVWEEI